ncbi:MAG: DUF3024 domain-containing protein [candidate division Zixibacteria bacterium]|nr:DUF3024 domain-containing protein [candidate division Zixibacteria bacterium]MDH3936894.1 DUF3024 domain-containing protein [candidate division Zixibacteria bacterium]MDH4035653.1 DUF3024 domain-containing protein [candidate division Zixibacteria bacterium]
MAFSKTETKRYEKQVAAFVEKRRPPEHIRDQVDIAFRIKGQSVEIFEIRPSFFKPKVKMEEAVAKATYVRTQGIWKVFWQRRDLKWHTYEPSPRLRTLKKFLDLVDEDALCCFWG